MTLLSFVIPCYRSEKTIEKVIKEIAETVAQRKDYDYEIVAVNDCSPDKVYEELKKIARENKKVKVINFAKNMGKHAAIIAGYSYVTGDYVVDLDDDYQCPTYDLWKLVEPVEKDLCDCAIAEYTKKKESFVKRQGSNFNSLMTQIMIGKPKGLRFENFSVKKRFIIDEIVNYKNPYPYIPGLVLRVTNRLMTVPMEERERGDNNKSGFTIGKSIALLMNGLTAFSVKPLRAAAVAGSGFAAIGFILGIIVVIRKLVQPSVPAGYSSLIAVLLLSSGLIMLMLGMIGEYLGRIYICINDSPQYVIRETINIPDKPDSGEKSKTGERE